MHLINTDFDSLASMLAIQKLYPDAVICPLGSMSLKVRDFMAKHGPHCTAKILKPKRIQLDEVTLMVVVDTRSRSRRPSRCRRSRLQPSLDVKYNVTLIIDCSGSMSNTDVRNAVSSSQNLIYALSDEDYAAVLAFGLGYYNVTEVIGTTKIYGNRQVINDSMSGLRFVLLSDGQDSIYDDVLQTTA